MWSSLLTLPLLAVFQGQPPPPPPLIAPHPAWKKTVVDKVFRSEGVAVADVNRDGKMDILNGEAWYEAPDWRMHEIRKLGDYQDGLKGYSNSFACWTDDFNSDGFPDLIVIGFPGNPCHWFENPKGKDGHWKQHEIWHSACNETPLYVDLLGNGKRVLLMGFQPPKQERMGQMAYFHPGADPEKPWVMHPVSAPSGMGKETPGTFKYAHGLGVGDLNKDGKLDVICTGGWWEQPTKVTGEPWAFHPARLGEACADMYVTDMDSDGLNDVVSSSAHKFGIWWHKQIKGESPNPSFNTRPLFPQMVSETHAMHHVDLDGDGVKDFVTGKRWFSHGRSEPGANWPAYVYMLKGAKGKEGLISLDPVVLDNDSGVGTQFTIADINGDGTLDVITSNKKGTYLLEQRKPGTQTKKSK
ncbi:MAG: VCBS repeat-containing protein [Gemmataceae bacterium]|nr:VCBS repeat-containing protein [Gemmataceae bacterium]